MAYLDSQLEFSDAQLITATALSTNVYDLGSLRKGGTAVAGDIISNLRQDIGGGLFTPWLYVTVNTAITGGTGTSLTATFETADDAALSTNATVIISSGAVLTANLTRGSTLMAFVLPSALYRRYIGLRFTAATGPYAAGAVDAYITASPNNNRIYKSGFVVQ